MTRRATNQRYRTHTVSDRNKLIWREAEDLKLDGEPGTLREIYFGIKHRFGLPEHI